MAQIEGLPVAAMRLFARLPEGGAPWRRVAAWDSGAIDGKALLALDVKEPVELRCVVNSAVEVVRPLVDARPRR